MTDEEMSRLVKVAEDVADYDDAGYYENESYRYICNWEEIVRAVLSEATGRKQA